ncbi:hypothetical protein ACFLFF_20430 [Brevibacillus reuszeri]
MGMTFEIMMPTADGKLLVDWEVCLRALRSKENAAWDKKNKT